MGICSSGGINALADLPDKRHDKTVSHVRAEGWYTVMVYRAWGRARGRVEAGTPSPPRLTADPRPL
jgi:hypothetical protein